MIRKDPGKVYNGEYLPLSTAIATIIILLLVGLGLYLILSPSNGKVDGVLFYSKSILK